jgi:integrase/recombinase XerD
MVTHNPNNERIKRRYFTFLKEAKRHSEATVDGVAQSLARFEAYTKYRDFKAFHYEQASAFKRHLAEQNGKLSGQKLSKATLNATLANLKRFFQWMAGQPGYKSRFSYSDAEYFNLSEKDARIATARREKTVPTVEQVKHVIGAMPAHSEIEQRNRAVIAFTLLTGARDSAIASMKLKHVDLAASCVYQDAREVDTKNSKTFTTYFFPVGDEIRQIVVDWLSYLRETKLWGNDDPLFPATKVSVSVERRFQVAGLDRKHWSNATAIRKIFCEAFQAAGLPYFNPHSLRNTLVQLGETLCKSPEEFKAWSQNLGHEQVLTTFCSYGQVASVRQGEIIRDLANPRRVGTFSADEIAKAVARELRETQQPNAPGA